MVRRWFGGELLGETGSKPAAVRELRVSTEYAMQ